MSAIRSRFNLTDNQLGILCVVVASLIFACQDATTKVLSAHYPVGQFLVIRFSVFFVFALIYVQFQVGITTALKAKRPLLVILRGVLIACEIGVFAFAVGQFDLSAQHALFAMAPLLTTALSVPLLGESVGLRRWLAVGAGGVGVLIILRPGVAVFDPLALVVLLAAVLFSFFNILSRKVLEQDSFHTGFLYMALVGFVIWGSIAPFYWNSIDPAHWPHIGILCMTAIAGHWLYAKAFQFSEASVLQPYTYLVLVFATLIGISIFNEILDSWTSIGASVVVSAGVYVWWRERQKSLRLS